LQNAGLWGGFFALLVLFFFLRRIRMTIILNIAIPLSILVSLTILYFIGWTLNLITMMGLMISIGMVVDNSIVVLENIYQKRSEGLNELVALVFIPLTASKVVSHRVVVEPAAIIKSNEKYQATLRWVLKRRTETFVILLLVLFSAFFALSKINKTDNMQGNINDFNLRLEMPDNYTVSDAARLVAQIEDSLRVKKEIYNIRTIDVRYRNNSARIHVFLQPEKSESWYEVIYKGALHLAGVETDKVMQRDAVVEDIKERLPVFPGVKLRTTWQQSGSGDASISLSLFGDDTKKLSALAEEVERRIQKIKEIVSVETDLAEGSDEIRLIINREQVQKYGINPRIISSTVMYALRGVQLPKYQTNEKEIRMLLQLREEDRETLEQLKNITFFTNNGREIPLDAVASFEVTKGFGNIHRENGKTYLNIKANTTSDEIGKVYEKIDKVMAGFEMPYGYTWSKGERFRNINQSSGSMSYAAILAIVFVFLLMGILFESFVLPLSVIISIPFSFVGGFWMLYLTNTPMDMMSMIGLVILIGIVVNNAIVLIDLVNRLRKEGYSRYDALLEAGKNRFRPILMTAFTTIGGLIPMAVGNAKMIGISYAPMGRTIIGGLIFSTMVSLIAVPWAYTIFDDMRAYFKRLTAGILNRKNVHAVSGTNLVENS